MFDFFYVIGESKGLDHSPHFRPVNLSSKSNEAKESNTFLRILMKIEILKQIEIYYIISLSRNDLSRLNLVKQVSNNLVK